MSPEASSLIELTPGQRAIVDAADFESLSQYSWHASWREGCRSFYAFRSGPGTISMAREVLGLESGDPRQADHVNFDGLDNRRSNLRIVTRQENCQHRRLRSDNTFRFKGVSVDGRGRIRAQIWRGSTNLHLGYFIDPTSAAIAYDQAALAMHGQFAVVNFPIIPAQMLQAAA